MDETPQRVLVVTPHPDDAEVWCGGTVARWAREGAAVHYVLCTDGGKGTDRPGITSQQLAATRQQEQLDAARLLGVKDVVMLGHPDGELEDNGEFRKELVRQVRLVRPDVVLCPEPYRRNLAWHRDHRIAGQVALDAVFPYARDHLHYAELWRDEELEPHKTAAILFWGTELPDTFIDIGGAMDLKLQALRCHRSLVAHRPPAEVVGLVRDRAAEAAAAAGQGSQYAEAFRKVTFRT
jgi:LmbE family N-acetylglucosaminyl deacetylase